MCIKINVERECTFSTREFLVRIPVSIALEVALENLTGRAMSLAQSNLGSLHVEGHKNDVSMVC